jgi:hypothetical protein
MHAHNRRPSQVVDEKDWVVEGGDWIERPTTAPDRSHLKVDVRDAALRTFERLAAQRARPLSAHRRWLIAVIQRR